MQLAEAECPPGAKFVPKGSPDAGVECFCVLNDGFEWGWQSKFFAGELKPTHWRQFDTSVETALNRHPNLVRYIICLPQDLSDARISEQTSALKKWEKSVSKWEGWAHDRGMRVEFNLWGEHKLLALLAKPENRGLHFFWFGTPEFSNSWFDERLTESIRAAGPRYTPEVHISLPIVQDLETFCRSGNLADRVKSREIETLQAFTELRRWEFAFPTADPAKIDLLHSRERDIYRNFSEFTVDPVEPLGVPPIVEQIDRALGLIDEVLENERLSLFDSTKDNEAENATPRGSAEDLYQDAYIRGSKIRSRLCRVADALEDYGRIADSNLLIVTGNAGVGKTHLLCDLIRRQVDAGKPALLLLGQSLTSLDDPWHQILATLDLKNVEVEVFLGALESAAQLRGCKALVAIDAINEGQGTTIWPGHLAAFLERARKSPWISVVLSIKSDFIDWIFEDGFPDNAVVIDHVGFGSKTFDAVDKYFAHHGLRAISAPILNPEFRNPLFLKTLCKGLQDSGSNAVPNDHIGLAEVFNLYLNGANSRLANRLDYRKNKPLVRKAVHLLANEFLDRNTRWVPDDVAEKIVNELLDRKEGYSNSLYFGLISEGVLVESAAPSSGQSLGKYVHFAYDRLADLAIADAILDRCSTGKNSNVAIAVGELSNVIDALSSTPNRNLFEALALRMPEVTGRELIDVAPQLFDDGRRKAAFLSSVAWRKIETISDETTTTFRKLLAENDCRDKGLDTLLSLAAIPDHPYNAEFLDEFLSGYSMADRDEFWSTYLHKRANSNGPGSLLINWAIKLPESARLPEQIGKLAAIALAWILSTPNRPLRDKATKALVALLTSRMELMQSLVDRFADLNDPYVSERVFAVAYGVSMRIHRADLIAPIALMVYRRIFERDCQPPSVLLRDYARGVVERAIYLGADIDIDRTRIRPPYVSQQPIIPTESHIRQMKASWGHPTDYDSLESSRRRIESSVMFDDFARYIIGSNFNSDSDWLSIGSDAPNWLSPDEELIQFIDGLCDQEKSACLRYLEKEKKANELIWPLRRITFDFVAPNGEIVNSRSFGPTVEVESAIEPQLTQANKEKNESLSSALASFRDESNRLAFGQLLANRGRKTDPPRIKLDAIKRYILWRVFDLGWTLERFGEFDRYCVHSQGRDADKPERISKKYQWIAYHEILAYLSDHQQFRERFVSNERDKSFNGPWQLGVRDIDPSCIFASPPVDGSAPPSDEWCCNLAPLEATSELTDRDWLESAADIPELSELLATSVPGHDGRWCVVDCHYSWDKIGSPRVGQRRNLRRHFWIDVKGYLIRDSEAAAYLEWASNVDFSGRWMPETRDCWEVFQGELGWSPAYRHFREMDDNDQVWIRPHQACPADVRLLNTWYSGKYRDRDCSTEQPFSMSLPCPELAKEMGIFWSGTDANFTNMHEKLVAIDPGLNFAGPGALLIRMDDLAEYCARKGLAICWRIVGEKDLIDSDNSFKDRGSLMLMAGCLLVGNDVLGNWNWSFRRGRANHD